MFRQAARPLARQQVSALTSARSLSTTKALPVRPLIQNVLDAQRRPQISPLLAQRALLTRQFVTSESRRASKDEPVAEKAVEKQSSVDFQHTTTGAKEEARAVVKDFAEMIAGRSPQAAAAGARESPHASTPMADDFYSVTRNLAQSIPPHIFNFGALGTVPYIGTAVGIIFAAREAGAAQAGRDTLTGIDLETATSLLHHLETVQITYGAIILSFLGALHWGMEFVGFGGSQGYKRLALGVVPVLMAWPTTFMTHGVSLAVQWAGFTGMWLLDQRASTHGWTPHWYSTYRFYLSIVVGFSIIATLTGTSYFGVGSGAGVPMLPTSPDVKPTEDKSKKRINKVSQKENPKVAGKQEGSVPGPIQAIDLVAEESGEGFVKLRNKEKEEEEAAEQAAKEEEEKKEKAEKQDIKEIDQSATSPSGMKTELKGRVDSNDQSQPEHSGSRGDDGEAGKEGR
ncbi:hypothetical protein FFLO_00436 [Filobasidium floriforme]|uniref:Mitochondrial inner membrane protein 1 n=1 Tax=Filobasidium floriforme TaxID=5210 RepID=A0A8K0JRX7_9TREE|nr:uncharacterized protein HD553DRAFT_300981 [Filobasidium floriforme]KAG7575272.1 hypothetical protein FFLO_00436 [Filobasidium floriforme]KAH8078940.1 hypothetical protein HD553DRAFT_300981 [Filobasidium floriforme]